MSLEFNNSKMYVFLKLEKQEIDKLKWIESEKLGRDIGRHKAVFYGVGTIEKVGILICKGCALNLYTHYVALLQHSYHYQSLIL